MTNRGTSALDVVKGNYQPSQESESEPLVSNSVKKPRLLILQEKYSNVFKNSLGKCTKKKVSIYLRDEVSPVFSNALPVPFAIKQKVQDELKRLVDMGVLQKIDYSDWAAPIVVVNKPYGKVRICGNFKALHRRISVDQHPIPTLDQQLEELQGGQFYSKIDLADAYL